MNDFFTNFFKTKSGQVVIAQFPNPPLILAIVFYFLKFIDSRLLTISKWGSAVFLLYWAYLEITQGVNLWRRSLGAVVLLILIVTILA